MNGSEAAAASHHRFTRFADLDAVLAVLVHGIRERLRGNFVGASTCKGRSRSATLMPVATAISLSRSDMT
jgi:hypothetical protein